MNLLTVLLPTARAELLRLLFSPGAGEVHLRDLARQSGLAIGTVQKEIAHLHKHGLVVSRRDGNRLYYKANVEQPIFAELQGLVTKTSGLQKVLQDALAGSEGIQMAFIYGSTAADKEQPTSDVDLMLIGSISLRSLIPHLRAAAETLGREINPHVFSAEEWTLKKSQGNAFIQSVLAGDKIWLQGNLHELKRLG